MGYRVSCSRSCTATMRNKEFSKGNISFLKGYERNRQDEYSSFKYYLGKTRAQGRILRYGESNLTLEYLQKLWSQQNGICPYTKYEMILPKNTNEYSKYHSPKKASLDRIDSTKGYVIGNVEFVCLLVNLAKNGFSKDEIMLFFQNLPLKK